MGQRCAVQKSKARNRIKFSHVGRCSRRTPIDICWSWMVVLLISTSTATSTSIRFILVNRFRETSKPLTRLYYYSRERWLNRSMVEPFTILLPALCRVCVVGDVNHSKRNYEIRKRKFNKTFTAIDRRVDLLFIAAMIELAIKSPDLSIAHTHSTQSRLSVADGDWNICADSKQSNGTSISIFPLTWRLWQPAMYATTHTTSANK